MNKNKISSKNSISLKQVDRSKRQIRQAASLRENLKKRKEQLLRRQNKSTEPTNS